MFLSVKTFLLLAELGWGRARELRSSSLRGPGPLCRGKWPPHSSGRFLHPELTLGAPHHLTYSPPTRLSLPRGRLLRPNLGRSSLRVAFAP